MFTIVISEKGGAERREAFEKSEVSVGRVQGNDLMLPKGNVSKHHARLLFRDARFIVTDLKSTNGTYVNGRKIAHATLVREGDKIYIGDFILRVDGSLAVSPPGSSYDSPPMETTGSAAPAQVPSSQDETAPAPASSKSRALAAPVPSSIAPSPVVVPIPATGARLSEPSAVSHYPLERDPDSESAPALLGAVIPRVPGPPPLPQAAVGRPSPVPVADSPLPRRTGAVPPARGKASAPGDAQPSVPFPPSAGPPISPLDRSAPRETAQHAARRLALVLLVDRVAGAVELAALGRSPEASDDLRDRVEVAVHEQVNAMREEGNVPLGVDPERLARDAVGELIGLGPLAALLDDEEIAEIHVARTDSVLVTRNRQTTLAETSFTSEEALARVVARLALQAGEPMVPGDAVVDRQLASGARLVALGPPATGGWALTIRKRRRVEASLDDLVLVGALSPSMALFLETCVTARANALVVGGGGALVTVLAAIAGAGVAGERVTVLQSDDEIVVAGAQTVAVRLRREIDSERTARAAAQLGTDRLVVASLEGATAIATLDVIAEGRDGVLAGIGAPSLRHGLARLVAQVAMARTGASVDAARELVGESFDIAVEVRRANDGRLRVQRVVELVGADAKGVATRDIFVSNAEATGEAAFSATGTIPRVAHDFMARGIRLDPGMFRKANRGMV